MWRMKITRAGTITGEGISGITNKEDQRRIQNTSEQLQGKNGWEMTQGLVEEVNPEQRKGVYEEERRKEEVHPGVNKKENI